MFILPKFSNLPKMGKKQEHIRVSLHIRVLQIWLSSQIVIYLSMFMEPCGAWYNYLISTGCSWSSEWWGFYCDVQGTEFHKSWWTIHAVHFDCFEPISSGTIVVSLCDHIMYYFPVLFIEIAYECWFFCSCLLPPSLNNCRFRFPRNNFD